MKEKQDNEANRLNIKWYIKSYTDSLKERKERKEAKHKRKTWNNTNSDTSRSVNSDGVAIYAHESLSVCEIVSIITDDDDWQPKVCRSIYHWTRKVTDYLHVETLEEHLLSPYTLVRNEGPNKEAMRERMRSPILCECGCKNSRNTISNHRKTVKHKTMLEEALL